MHHRNTIALTLTLVVGSLLSAQQRQPEPPQDPGVLLAALHEQQVFDNIVQQQVGVGTIAGYNLPDHFVRRLADREIIASYQWQFHRIYDDRQDAPDDDAGDGPAVSLEGEPVDPSSVHVHRADHPQDRLAWRAQFVPDRPGLRGFRASILGGADDRWPANPPADATPAMRRALTIVAEQLAEKGLLRTLWAVLDALGAERFIDADETTLQELRATGLPVDLLGCFRLPPDEADAPTLVRRLSRAIVDAASDDDVETLLRTAHFRFTPTRDGFRLVPESGNNDLQLLRVQLPVGRYFKGPGDGNGADIARQMLKAAPEAGMLISLHRDDLDMFMETVTTWRRGAPAQRIDVAVEPLEIGQWTQDGGKAGFVMDGPVIRTTTVLPRFASRRDDGAEFVTGDSFLAEGLSAAGHTVFQSPLLFQGGNMLCVEHPETGRRTLLLGEPELYRNIALGLTQSEVVACFRVEMGVDRVVILPMVSFHLDYDVTVRAHRQRLVGFVNETTTARRIILQQGIAALERGGLVDAEQRERLLHQLASKAYDQFLNDLGAIVYGVCPRRGYYPLSFAEHFSTGPTDSGPGNLKRFLLAIEMLAAETLQPRQLPQDGQSQAYFRALKRRESHRLELHGQLRNIGWWLISVPSLPMADASVSTINGIHDRKRYYMPAWGGLYAPLDEAALAKLRSYLGETVEVVPIRTAESQRRAGAVHCSVLAY